MKIIMFVYYIYFKLLSLERSQHFMNIFSYLVSLLLMCITGCKSGNSYENNLLLPMVIRFINILGLYWFLTCAYRNSTSPHLKTAWQAI